MNRLYPIISRLVSAAALVTLSLLFLSSAGVRADAGETFNAANKLYEQQKFAAAAAEYEKLVQSSNISSAIYFNLGNAYFKAGQLGRAIAAYRRAEDIAPRDPDIQANLQFARNEAGSKWTESLWGQWVHRFTLNGWTSATVIFIWLFFGLLIIGHWRPEWRKTLRLWSIVFATGALFCGTCFSFSLRDRLFTNPAVVIVQEAVARRGPFEESQSYFSLRDGAEIFVVDRKDKWVQVADSSRRTGWLPESQVLVLNGGQ